MKLIQTKDYLLLIDEEAEIKEGNLVVRVYEDDIMVSKSLPNSDNLKRLKDKRVFLLVAYYPLTKEAKELDLPLLPNPFKEVDIEKEALDVSELKNRWGHLYTFGYPSKPYPTGFQHDLDMIMLGLYKSKSKQFSLEDVKKAFLAGQESCSDPNIPLSVNSYIQSLSTQQLPKEFIPKFDIVHTDHAPNGFEKILKFKTNSEGKQEIQGTYKY